MEPARSLASVAIRVHRMAEMEAFYAEAFGARFRDVRTGPIVSRFAEIDGMTLKLVPIRDAVDFVGFPVHQLGFHVSDVETVVAIANRHGGKVLDVPRVAEGRVIAAIRDPDGNTLELCGPRKG